MFDHMAPDADDLLKSADCLRWITGSIVVKQLCQKLLEAHLNTLVRNRNDWTADINPSVGVILNHHSQRH